MERSFWSVAVCRNDLCFDVNRSYQQIWRVPHSVQAARMSAGHAWKKIRLPAQAMQMAPPNQSDHSLETTE